jgi:hypothetical protein
MRSPVMDLDQSSPEFLSQAVRELRIKLGQAIKGPELKSRLLMAWRSPRSSGQRCREGCKRGQEIESPKKSVETLKHDKVLRAR